MADPFLWSTQSSGDVTYWHSKAKQWRVATPKQVADWRLIARLSEPLSPAPNASDWAEHHRLTTAAREKRIASIGI
jgi:hypothetical protein